MNTWPGGHRHAMHQHEHEKWNAGNYPGTRQLCGICDEPTGRCEDDILYLESEIEIIPLCENCYLLAEIGLTMLSFFLCFKLWDGTYEKDFYEVDTEEGAVEAWPNAGKMIAMSGGREWLPGECRVRRKHDDAR